MLKKLVFSAKLKLLINVNFSHFMSTLSEAAARRCSSK